MTIFKILGALIIGFFLLFIFCACRVASKIDELNVIGDEADE
jgi:hypothetical protein